MNRIVLVSGPSKEFPDNTTSLFKVRLPVPLELKGEGWKVGLAAISTPDAGLDLTRLSNAVNPRVFMVNAKLMGFLAQGVTPVMQRSIINISDLTNDPSVQDGVTLMKALITRSHFMEVKKAQSTSVRVFEHLRVTYRWEGEDLWLEAKLLADIMPTLGIVYIQWHVHVSMAKLMGWLVETKDDTYELGPNVRYEGRHVKAQQYKYIQPSNNTELNRHDLWKVEGEFLQLSLTVNWIFFNLNMVFRNVVGEPLHTFLVYSDLVDSNIVGGQQHALVREVEYRHQGRAWHTLNPCTFSGCLVVTSTWTPWRSKWPKVTEGWSSLARGAPLRPLCLNGTYKKGMTTGGTCQIM